MWELKAKYLHVHYPSFDYCQVCVAGKNKGFSQYLVRCCQLLKCHHFHQRFVVCKGWEGEHKQGIGLGGMLVRGVRDRGEFKISS